MVDLARRCSGSTEGRFLMWECTKWCGPGNNAKCESDLGPLEADKCCRTHDHCDYIASGETKYGITNYAFFTKLNCKCEEAFDRCLTEAYNKEEKESAKSSTKRLQNFYFGTYSPECYVVTCNSKRSGRDAGCENGVATWKKSYKD
uniref:Phospholipase A2 phospholipin n=1 Tax=Pandinus imperator TaxID=55084 RepID=PA2_PANIM|nr:RecName: Full=Phospholipase A2 phospholipin; AltName: Full=Phosphatidylcholine 2-acylhydrolase; Contains: RecName: Full=Phospholipase A2 large subunit; Contains: RecName: Full=Phospholipase A2 small subunit; Flags: Precursor [Pandinus imperator]